MSGSIAGSKIDLVESSGADLPPTGTTRIIRKGGVTQQSVDGAAFAALGASGSSGGWRATYEANAAARLGSSNFSPYYRGFEDGLIGWTQNLVGTGVAQAISIPDSTDAVASLGGTCTFGTGTSTNGASELYRLSDGAAGLAPFLAYTDITKKFYYACRFQLSSAADANAACGIGVRNWLMGVYGANSTTKFSMRAGGASGFYLTSTVSVDTNFHLMETWHDGSSAWFSVDGETPVTAADTAWWATITGNGTNTSAPVFTFAKVTGATNYTGAASFGFWAIKP